MIKFFCRVLSHSLKSFWRSMYSRLKPGENQMLSVLKLIYIYFLLFCVSYPIKRILKIHKWTVHSACMLCFFTIRLCRLKVTILTHTLDACESSVRKHKHLAMYNIYNTWHSNATLWNFRTSSDELMSPTCIATRNSCCH